MVQVKICGITNLLDAQAAAQAGADLIGFVFVPNTPRYVAPQVAKDIVAALGTGARPRFVGVFVNAPLEQVRAILESVPLDRVQLHGGETPSMVRSLAPRACKSLRPRDDAEAQAQVTQYRAAVHGHQPAFIVDAFDAHKWGGTGARADWAVAAKIASNFPILLAGGLNADNVAEAIRAVRPWGVDVSSGVEHAPGLKDHDKVRQFIQAVRGVER